MAMLDAHTRNVLRAIVRRVHFAKTQRMLNVSDAEIDKFIDAQLPETLDRLERHARAAGLPQAESRKFSMPGVSAGGRVRTNERLARMVRRHSLRLQDTLAPRD